MSIKCFNLETVNKLESDFNLMMTYKEQLEAFAKLFKKYLEMYASTNKSWSLRHFIEKYLNNQSITYVMDCGYYTVNLSENLYITIEYVKPWCRSNFIKISCLDDHYTIKLPKHFKD